MHIIRIIHNNMSAAMYQLKNIDEIGTNCFQWLFAIKVDQVALNSAVVLHKQRNGLCAVAPFDLDAESHTSSDSLLYQISEGCKTAKPEQHCSYLFVQASCRLKPVVEGSKNTHERVY